MTLTNNNSETDTENIINQVLEYATHLVGTGRGPPWQQYQPSTNLPPLWCSDQPLPSINTLKEDGINCSGLINIMRRKAGVSVLILNTETTEVLGGTLDWFRYLKSHGRLEIFDIYQTYPRGSLLLRDYNNIDDGHLAVVYQKSDRGILYSQLLHSDGYLAKKIVIDPCVAKSHYTQYNNTTNMGHYTHICLPENWLINE